MRDGVAVYHMKSFLYKVLLFAIFTLVGAILAAYTVEKIYYADKDLTTRSGFFYLSNLFPIEQNGAYDFVIMGSSTSDEIRPCFVPSFPNNAMNLSFPGGGMKVQKTYLEYFYEEGNKVDKILYCLDPYVLVTDYGDRLNYLFNYEPFRMKFASLIFENLGPKIATKYLFSKVRFLGFANYTSCPIEYPSMHNALDTARENGQVRHFYGREDRSELQKKRLAEIIKLAKAHNSSIIFYIPPSLLSKDPNYKNTLAYLEELSKEDFIEYYDFKNIFLEKQDHKFFRDYVHLNGEGATRFYENYLSEVIK